MGIYLYKGADKKLLRKDRKDEICSDIESKFSLWYGDLEDSRKDAVAILKEIYPTYDNKKREFKKVPDTYEQYKTYWSAIATSTYQNSYKGMFDIEGQDLRSNNLASIYKSALIYDFNRMNLKSSMDAMLDDWIIKGESAAFIHWDEDIERKQDIQENITVDPITGQQTIEVIKVMKDESNGGHVHIKRIDPHNLYYDKSQRHNWQMCGKIYRDFLPIQYILTNTEFGLSDNEKKEIRKLIDEQTTEGDDTQQAKTSKDRVVWGNNIEVLEFRGDYITPDGVDYVKDAVIVVIARKYLARIEQSQYPKCPIIYATYLDRPDTLRGQSPLKAAYILSDVENKCMDLQLKAWELNVVPTFLAPKGAFQAYTKLTPGQPIEYDGAATFGGQTPQKLDFSSGMRGFDFQTFFRTKMEGATGMTQYLQGSQEGSVRTAEESSFIQAGASMRKSTEVYLFSNKLILPLVKTYALFKKEMEDGEHEIAHTTSEGQNIFVKVNEDIRNGNYTFLMDGAGTAVQREAELRQLFTLLGLPAFQSLLQLMDVDTSLEFLKWILNRGDFSGTSQIFEMLGINNQISQFANNVGIQPENKAGFNQDIRATIKQQLPQIMAQKLLTQQGQPEMLPQ